MMDNFWISFCGELTEGYKPDFNIHKNKPDYHEGYIYIHVYTADFIASLKVENALYREALDKIQSLTFSWVMNKDNAEDILLVVAPIREKCREALKGE